LAATISRPRKNGKGKLREQFGKMDDGRSKMEGRRAGADGGLKNKVIRR
jgi:uncharacterized protein YjbJ (UPF0337 family)